MRIAFLFEHPTVSGAEGSGLELLAQLDRREFQATAFAPPEGELALRLAALGVPHRPWPAAPRDGGVLRAALEPGGFDLLHANTLHLGRLTGAAAADLGLPTAAHIREFGTLGARERAHLCANARLIAVSAALRDDLTAQGIPAEKIRVIYNGVSPPPAAGRFDLRAELGLPAGAPLVVWLGQITVRKAPEVFVAAAAEIARREARAHFVLCGEVFGGKAENLRLKDGLLAAAARPPLAGRLHLLGWRRDARAILAQATVLAHTARQEPLGRVLIEALAAGTPVAATRVGGTAEVLGSCGELFEPDNPSACADALAALLGDEGRRAAFAREGRARWAARFRTERMAAETRALWREIAADRTRPEK